MKVYQVINWESVYENNKSRERDKCSFVCIPNDQGGLGFTLIMNEKNGASIYGIFCLIVGMLSRQKKPRNGWLTEDGHSTGTPLALSALAVLWRRKEEEISQALDVLTNPKVGWMSYTEVIDNEHETLSARPVPDQCPTSALEENRRERNRREENNCDSEQVRSRTKIPDSDFINALKENPAYRGIDIDRELGRMDAWLLTPKGQGRQKTRGFIVRWLNKIDVTMPSQQPASVEMIQEKTVLDIIEEQEGRK